MNRARWADLINRMRVRLELKLEGQTDGLVVNMHPATLNELFSGPFKDVPTWPGFDSGRFQFIGLTFVPSTALSEPHAVVTQRGRVVALVDGHREDIKV